MTNLIDRLKQAPEGSRELDGDIALSLGWKKRGKGWAHWVSPDGRENQQVPFFTESIDDALTLLPEGTEYAINTLYGIAMVEVGLNYDDQPFVTERKDGNVVLAICTAAMKARSAS